LTGITTAPANAANVTTVTGVLVVGAALAVFADVWAKAAARERILRIRITAILDFRLFLLQQTIRLPDLWLRTRTRQYREPTFPSMSGG